MKSNSKIFLTILGVLTAAITMLCWAVAKEKLPLGFDEWRWDYHQCYYSVWQIISFTLLLFALVGIWALIFQKCHNPILKWLILLVGAGLIMFILTFSLYRIQRMNNIVNAFGTIGYFTLAKKFDSIPELLAGYTLEIAKPENFRTHPSTHPVGTTALYWVFWKIDNIFFPQWDFDPLAGYLPLLFAWLATVPLYLICRRFFIVALFTLTPTILFFAPLPEPVIMCLAIWAFYLVYRCRSYWAAVFAGILFAQANLITLSALPLLGGTLLWLFFFKKELKWRERFLQIAIIIAVIVLCCLALYWIWGYNLWENFKISQPSHAALIYGERSYLPWLYWNLYDYGLFLGIPAAFLIVWGLTSFFISFRRYWSNQSVIIAAVFFLMLILTNFSGTVRGEMARLYMSYTPFLLLAVNFKKNYPRWFMAGIIILMILQFIIFWAKINTISIDIPTNEIKLWSY